MKLKKKNIIMSIIFLVLLVTVIIIGIFYNRKALYYETHFYPGTYVNGFDCSDLEVEEVISMLDAQIEGYLLEVVGRDYLTGKEKAVLGRIVPDDINLTFLDTRGIVLALLGKQEPYKWIYGYGEKEVSYVCEQEVTFDEEKLKSLINSWEACQEVNMLKAQDAYIDDSLARNNRYEIIAETIGTELDVDRVVQLAAEAVRQQEKVLDVEEYDCYQSAEIKQDDSILANAVETANTWLSANIIYDWNGTEVGVAYEELKEWISMGDNGPVLDKEAIAQFVAKQAALHDTYGMWRSFRTALGVDLTLPSGYYGWKTDREAETEELIRLIQEGAAAQRTPIYSSTAQKKGRSDIGNTYVEADLTHQHLYLFQNGNIVLETDFVSGDMSSKPGNVTPEGVFGVAYKTTNAILRGEDYRTPVTYWMPYFGNYGMHDATWRSEFGGDIYIANGSHGCINLPLDKAAQIYQYVYAGFPVICYYYEVDPLVGQNTDSEEGDTEEWDEDEAAEDD